MKKHRFTLVEVVVALAILGITLVSLLTLAGAAQQRLGKARDRWRNFHMLSQGAEYFMLFTSEEPPGIDLAFFDVEDLPEELTGLVGQPPLRCCVVELVRNADGEVLDTLKIDRINYDAEESD